VREASPAARKAGGVDIALPRDPIPWLIALLGGFVLCYALWWLSGPGDQGLAGRFTGAATLPGGLIVLLCVVRLRGNDRVDPKIRGAWSMVGLGLVCYGAGSVARFTGSAIPPAPFLAPIAPALEIGAYPILWVALARLPRVTHSRTDAALFSLDVMVVAWSAAMLLWHFLLIPVARGSGADLPTTFAAALYPVGDISIVFATAAMSIRGLLTSSRAAVSLGAGALLLIFTGDVIAGIQELQGGYVPGGLSGLVYSIAWVGLAASAYLQTRVADRFRPVHGLAGYARSFPWLVYFIAATAFVAPAIRNWNDLELLEQHIPASALLLALVLARLAVTAHEHASQAAAERERLATAVDQASDAILTTDRSGNVAYVNRAFTRITGFTSEYAVGRNPSFLREDADPAHLADIAASLARGESWHGRLGEKCLGGGSVEVDLTVTPLQDAAGAVVGSVEVARDISRERALEDRLAEAERMEAVGRLAGGVAHDFNNILTAISGFTELAMAEVGDGPAAEDLEEVVKASDRAAALTRALLAFGRRGVMQRQPVDLNEVVAGLSPMLGVLMGEDVELSVRPDPALGLTLTDRAQFEQVVLNLALNARDAMPEGGRLTIATANVDLDGEYAQMHVGATRGPHVQLSVADTGAGMTREVLSHAFEPFFTTKPRGKGTGLGLSTVIGVVQQSGGSVDVSSAPDQGTTFSIYLPRAEGAGLAHKTDTAAGGAAQGGRETILVAEDEEAVRAFVGRVLSGAGYRVVVAANGPEALSMAATLPHVDLLFTDMIMPGMGGRELAAQLMASHPQLRTVYASGYSEDAIRQGLEDDGSSYLAKPFTADRLLARVREVLEGK
jgi:PAS domain S-box-containing protein